MQNGRGFDWGFDPAADWADAWRPGIGAVCHACGGHADMAGWTGSMAQLVDRL